MNCFTNLLVVLEAGPVEVKDHVHDASVVADDVEVAVVDQGSEAETVEAHGCYKDAATCNAPDRTLYPPSRRP